MEKAVPSPSQVLSLGGSAKDESGLFSSESVPDILRLISAGSPLPATLNVIARLVESQGEGFFCTTPQDLLRDGRLRSWARLRSAHSCCPKRVTCD